ncbi:NADH-quinone oxidoreductase subunit M [Buchnera aphidicola (Thelaxes suberi)]|uniref:complex I subunit 4 family protein n=1 Tax=Buchnera aphidicola TaxID=9 RepID=UPI0034638E21
MLLSFLVIIPFLSGIFSFLLGFVIPKYCKKLCLLSLLITLFLCILIWYQKKNYLSNIHGLYSNEFLINWIDKFGIHFHLFLDGLSFLMVMLTCVLSIISILSIWNQNYEKIGFFYFNLMCMITGMIGVFTSVDLFLFFLFWELSSIPVYFFIICWGKKTIAITKRIYIANQFLIYTQISGLLLFLGILVLAWNFYDINHYWSFNYFELSNMALLNPSLEYYCMLMFFFSFIIKLPIFPFHNWLIDAHKSSPVSGFLDITGLLLKTSIYGLLRFNIFIFPYYSKKIMFFITCIGIVNIIYNSFMAIKSNNIKEIIAYTSLSHIGFILIGIYNSNYISYQGIIIQIISTSLSIAALFIIASQLYHKLSTHNIHKMGGLWGYLKWIPSFSLFFIFANLGLPGTANFVGEFMVLLGIIKNNFFVTIVIVSSMILSAIYSLRLFHKIYFGPFNQLKIVNKYYFIEFFALFMISFLLVYIGFFPQIIFNISNNVMDNIYSLFLVC